jgi:hypothetical protein
VPPSGDIKRSPDAATHGSVDEGASATHRGTYAPAGPDRSPVCARRRIHSGTRPPRVGFWSSQNGTVPGGQTFGLRSDGVESTKRAPDKHRPVTGSSAVHARNSEDGNRRLCGPRASVTSARTAAGLTEVKLRNPEQRSLAPYRSSADRRWSEDGRSDPGTTRPGVNHGLPRRASPASNDTPYVVRKIND